MAFFGKQDPPGSRDSSGPLIDLPSWRYFLQFFRGHYRRLALTAFISVAQSLVIIPTLLLVRYVFDNAIPQKNVRVLVFIGIGIFAFRLVNSGLSLWVRSMNIRTIKTAIFNLREDLLKRLYALSRTAHTQLDQKTTHARIVLDTERLSNMSDSLISQFLPAVFTGLALIIALLFLNWYLFLIMISIAPVIFFASRYTGTLVKKEVHSCQRSFEAFSKGVMFSLRHMDLTRVQTAESQEMERQTGILRDLRSRTGNMIFMYAVHGNVQSILTGLSGVIILIVGGISVTNGTLTLGEFISFYVAAGYLNGYVNTITSSVAVVLAGNESMVTLHQLAETKNVQPYTGKKQVELKGFFSLKSVSFRYGDRPLLNNVSLRLRPDSKIAIIGPNGIGKSTVTQLILGFYRPLSGGLFADDLPYEELDMIHLRKQIGVVMQDPALFSGTVLESISYGSVDGDRERIIRAARMAMADEFIRKLPEGYDTQIGEDGVLLSGGERQRLALARALLRRPKLLILDEPTNHLDRAAIRQLIGNLDELDDRPSILIISHDMNVITSAHEVYQLKNGVLRPAVPVLASSGAEAGGCDEIRKGIC